ncbi:MAG TPA: hypothetical protein VJ570_04845, partial [Holophagaceae bacterium]|nr:hypothetical protein [Holophagaceae bacterium]
LQDLMTTLINSVDTESLRVRQPDPSPDSPFTGQDSYGTQSSTTGVLRIFMRSGDYPATSQLFLDKTGQAQNSVIQQAFGMELRYLGKSLTNQGSGSKAKKKGNLFMIRSLGRANAGADISFIAQREVLVDYLPN